MSCPTGVLLLYALQQIKFDLSVEELSMLHQMCYKSHNLRRVVWLVRQIVSGSSSMALCVRNVHITLYDVTTWSWVNLVNPGDPGDLAVRLLHTLLAN